jgi:guanylate kinase
LAELQAATEYQYVVVNDRLEQAVERVSGILDAEAMRRERLTGLERDLRSIVERLEKEINA